MQFSRYREAGSGETFLITAERESISSRAINNGENPCPRKSLTRDNKNNLLRPSNSTLGQVSKPFYVTAILSDASQINEPRGET